MARNYEKELADAEAKVKRIKQQKAAAERRKYEPVGRAMYAVFSAELRLEWSEGDQGVLP